MALKQLICKRGHNKDIVGRTLNGGCHECKLHSQRVIRSRMTIEDKLKQKEAVRQYRLRLHREDPDFVKERDKRSNLKKNYGISLEDYNKLFNDQNGLCLGCYRHQKQLTRSLDVDHCHDSGKVRGLLCSNCNRSLGWANESPEILRRLAEYIEKRGS